MVDIFNGRVPGWAGVASGQCTPGYTLVPTTPAPRLFSAHPGAGAKNRAPTGLPSLLYVFLSKFLHYSQLRGIPAEVAQDEGHYGEEDYDGEIDGTVGVAGESQLQVLHVAEAVARLTRGAARGGSA